jgi:hypothetical protein
MMCQQEPQELVMLIESFYYDRFPERLRLVSLRNAILLKIFGTSGNSSVAIGRDRNGFFYFLPEPRHAQINYPSFSSESLGLWAASLEGKRKWSGHIQNRDCITCEIATGTMLQRLS